VGDIVRIARILGAVCAWNLLPFDDTPVVRADIHYEIARVVQRHAELVQNVPEGIVPSPAVIATDAIEI
jgi:hypothetical protein